MKSPGSTGELLGEPQALSQVEAPGTIGGAVKCVDIYRNAKCEDRVLGLY